VDGHCTPLATKTTTRRVSGASEEAPSPNTANNLLENRVNDLESEVETLQGKLELSEESRKQANARSSLFGKEVKLLKEEKKTLGSDELAQDNRRLKAEVVVLSNASAKANRLGEELVVAKATVKELRMQVAKGTTGYSKLLGKYNQLKKDAAKTELSLTVKKEAVALKAEINSKEKKQKQDEATVAAGVEARKMHEFKLKLKLERGRLQGRQERARAQSKGGEAQG
jgi:hypothetical protein